MNAIWTYYISNVVIVMWPTSLSSFASLPFKTQKEEYLMLDSDSSTDLSPIMNELALITCLGKFVLKLDTDSDILDSKEIS